MTRAGPRPHHRSVGDLGGPARLRHVCCSELTGLQWTHPSASRRLAARGVTLCLPLVGRGRSAPELRRTTACHDQSQRRTAGAAAAPHLPYSPSAAAASMPSRRSAPGCPQWPAARPACSSPRWPIRPLSVLTPVNFRLSLPWLRFFLLSTHVSVNYLSPPPLLYPILPAFSTCWASDFLTCAAIPASVDGGKTTRQVRCCRPLSCE